MFAQTSNTAVQEQRVVELINIERARQNLPPLILHDTLTSIAFVHSEDMLPAAAFSNNINVQAAFSPLIPSFLRLLRFLWNDYIILR